MSAISKVIDHLEKSVPPDMIREVIADLTRIDGGKTRKSCQYANHKTLKNAFIVFSFDRLRTARMPAFNFAPLNCDFAKTT